VINTTTSKFGTGSLQLTGSTFENTLTLTDAALPLAQTGSRISFDFWVYFDNVSAQSLEIRYSNSTVSNGFDLRILSGSMSVSLWGNSAITASYATGFTNGTWNHVAFVITWGNNLRMYANGVRQPAFITLSAFTASQVTTTPRLQLVRSSGPSGNILIDEFRITAGLISTGLSFAVPTTPYTV
jgi:hypothetical protein